MITWWSLARLDTAQHTTDHCRCGDCVISLLAAADSDMQPHRSNIEFSHWGEGKWANYLIARNFHNFHLHSTHFSRAFISVPIQMRSGRVNGSNARTSKCQQKFYRTTHRMAQPESLYAITNFNRNPQFFFVCQGTVSYQIIMFNVCLSSLFFSGS